MTRSDDREGPPLGSGTEAMKLLAWRPEAANMRPASMGDGANAPIQGKGIDELPTSELRIETADSGEPLPDEVRAKMEAALGMDFSGVRIHVGPEAASMGALAFARGPDIFFAPGQYQPWSRRGQELLGHELTHVVQQARGRVSPTAQTGGIAVNDDPTLEREADEMGAKVARSDRMVDKPRDGSGTTRKSSLSRGSASSGDRPSGRAGNHLVGAQAGGPVARHAPGIATVQMASDERYLILQLRQMRDAMGSLFSAIFYIMQETQPGALDFCAKGRRAPIARKFLDDNKQAIVDFFVEYAMLEAAVGAHLDKYSTARKMLDPFLNLQRIPKSDSQAIGTLFGKLMTGFGKLSGAKGAVPHRIVLNENGEIIGYTAVGGETHGGCNWSDDVLWAYDLQGRQLKQLRAPSTEPMFSPLDLVGLGLFRSLAKAGVTALIRSGGKMSNKVAQRLFTRLGKAGGKAAGKGTAKQGASAVAEQTVWSSIKATEKAVVPGTVIPRSFELSVAGGSKYWVHPNATKHMGEYITRFGATHGMKMQSQAMLKSFKAAVDAAVKNGVEMGKMIKIGGWELIFSPARAAGKLPVIKHALYIP